MLPPIYTTLQASATVRTLLGNQPRVHRYGEAPQGVAMPYATWLTLGAPENTLSEAPGIDRNTVQIDVWAATQNSCEEVAVAVRDALEPHCHMTQFQTYPRDEATRKYRISMDFDWFQARE